MIIKAPNPILTQKSRPVKKIDAKIRRIISQMKEALAQSKIGVGLAAPQIGIPLQIFIITHKTHKPHESYESYKPLVFINPQITKLYQSPTLVNKLILQPPTSNLQPPTSNLQPPTSNLQPPTSNLQPPTSNIEGCLSLPNVWGQVARAKKLTLKYLDEKGKKHHHLFRGFLATIIQHEVDHLNGVLFTEHVLSQSKKLYREKKDKKTGKRVMEEIEI